MAPSVYVFNVFTFLNTVVPPRRRDIVGELPPEMGCHILRMLDIDSLVNVVLVSLQWQNLCLHDPVLCRRIMAYIHERRRVKKENRAVDTRLRTVRSIFLDFFKKRTSSACGKRKRSGEPQVTEPPTKRRAMRF
ncbi:hypothetical protein GE061_012024 [Apolygus lucorum]|uniref:F-box domain-containing protein n=1 Tax=Apolygus lucorum TaxID=248454 RepID=A0A8S9XR19_APOLU|nr:hypothetical protein GE061_012024 [Apolygus lucorum]